ncbi:hypothetical protein [Mycobacterium gordonae]|nr:hypothetical protein [Mycobacterium gordonae]MCV7009486.1 hypothetical protein [Mycobacterium gordonae]
MIIVTTEGQRREFPTAQRFLTEEEFNNLVLMDSDDHLVAVFAQDKWISVELVDGS